MLIDRSHMRDWSPTCIKRQLFSENLLIKYSSITSNNYWSQLAVIQLLSEVYLNTILCIYRIMKKKRFTRQQTCHLTRMWNII